MKQIVENRLKNALKRLYHFDDEIIKNDSHERSITHRLAIHLGSVFYEWDVDVEYNRNLGDKKQIDTVPFHLLSKINNIEDVISGRKSVYPDIIVHKRNTDKNHLVIELKKDHSTEAEDQYDREKIKAYLFEDTLRYDFAAFIKLGQYGLRPRYLLEIKTREDLMRDFPNGN